MELKKTEQAWLDDIYEKLLIKMDVQCKRIGTDIPFFPYKGKYVDCMMPDGICWWTNGFWPGMLWQMYNATGDENYRTVATGIEERMQETLQTPHKLHHDVGFMFLPTAVANFKKTGNDVSYQRGLLAANLLAGRFNPTGEFIRAWNESLWAEDVSGWMIIDSLLNLPLLYWASKESKDPRYADVANRHAHTSLHTLLRPDGSSNHIASFNSATGEFLGGVGGQGYGEGSSWSRGQAWAVYGYALAYRHTGLKEYLDAAKQCAHYCISNFALQDWLPLLDFRAPQEPVKYDSGAGAIFTCGLLEIATHVPKLEQALYTDAALNILRACEKKFVNWDPKEDGILGGGSTMYHGDQLANMAFIYGDYFFLEAILRFKNKNMMIW